MSSINYHQSKASPARGNQKIFKKSLFRQYGILFILIPLFLISGLGMFAANSESRTIFLVTAVISLLISFIPFLQVNEVKVEPNKLTIKTFFEEKVLIAQEIKEIEMQSQRARYGRVIQIVQIIPLEGKNYPIANFKDKSEVIHDFLIKWWNHYRN